MTLQTRLYLNGRGSCCEVNCEVGIRLGRAVEGNENPKLSSSISHMFALEESCLLPIFWRHFISKHQAEMYRQNFSP